MTSRGVRLQELHRRTLKGELIWTHDNPNTFTSDYKGKKITIYKSVEKSGLLGSKGPVHQYVRVSLGGGVIYVEGWLELNRWIEALYLTAERSANGDFRAEELDYLFSQESYAS